MRNVPATSDGLVDVGPGGCPEHRSAERRWPKAQPSTETDRVHRERCALWRAWLNPFAENEFVDGLTTV